MPINPIIIGAVVMGIPIIWLLGLTRGPNKGNFYHVGETLRKEAKKGGFRSKLKILGIIIFVFLALFAAFIGFGEVIISFLKNLGK